MMKKCRDGELLISKSLIKSEPAAVRFALSSFGISGAFDEGEDYSYVAWSSFFPRDDETYRLRVGRCGRVAVSEWVLVE